MFGFGAPAFFHSLIFVVALVPNETYGLDLGKCQTALGMQTGDIKDEALNASSSMDLSTGPRSARIRSEIRGGAWCPKKQITKDSYEFLEIDVGQLHVISVIETQGRFGNGQGQEYTEQFRLEYQRERGGKWFQFRNRRGQEIIQGNMNTHTAEMRDLQPPLIARKIRFVPLSNHPKTVCLRVELYGCLWHDGVVSYSMPQGEHRGLDLSFVDSVYDGSDDNGFLSNGIGQLFDGEEGQSNFRLDVLGLGLKGFEWIGWRNDTFPSGYFDAVFKFDGLRNFTSVSLHCNNLFTRDVRVFSKAQIYFSETEEPDPVFGLTPLLEFTYFRDSLMDYARTVTISLEHNVGRFVKIRLYFDARWLMISEMHFVADLVKAESTGFQLPSSVEEVFTKTDSDVLLSTDSELGKSLIPHIVQNVTVDTEVATVSWNVSRIQNKNRSGIYDESIAIMITVLVVVVLTLCAVIIIIAFKRTKHSCFHHRFPQGAKTGKPPASAVGNGSNSLSGPQLITFSQTSGLLPLNAAGHSSYLSPSCHQQDSDELDQSETTSPLIMAPVCASASPYSAVDFRSLVDFRNCEHGASRFCTMPRKPNHKNRNRMLYGDFPRESMKFVKSLGTSPTGEVYLCELLQSGNKQQIHCSSHTLTPRTPSLSHVAVKVVSKNASDQAREDFQREASALSRLSDPHIIQLLGVFMDSDPSYIILEYLRNGNLKEFLRNCTLEGTTRRGHKNTVSYGCLIYMASQIALGMKFLECNNLIHRDLAARNCLVDSDYTVKISDFGVGHSQFPSDYYTSSGAGPLPIRWMAWEALRWSNFSAKSDVWSFAVTMWEMLTLARQPYETLTDEQVVTNSNNLLQSPGHWVALDHPPVCPREVYDLLCHCWSRDKSQRPTFHEVHMFLQRKNAGYRPDRGGGCSTTPSGHPKASVSHFM